MKIDFRPAFMKDFDGCWTVINEAREQMIKSGRHQWTEQYPAYKDIRQTSTTAMPMCSP